MICQVGPAVPAAVFAVALVRQVVLELGSTHGPGRPSGEASKALTHKLRPRSDSDVVGLLSKRDRPHLLSKHTSLPSYSASTALLPVLRQNLKSSPNFLFTS